MFSWEFSNKKNRGPIWYIIGLIVVGTLVMFGILTQFYLLSVITVLFTGVIVLIENNTAPTTRVNILEDRVIIDNETFMFEKYATFRIITIDNYAYSLRFLSEKRFGTSLDIPFSQEVDVEALKNFLLPIFPTGKDEEIS